MANLEKAKIINLDKNETIEVLFNPKEYTLRKSTQWEPHKSPGLNSPEIEFTSGNNMTLAADLFFDTYEEKKDCRPHTDRLLKLALVEVTKHRPPLCQFQWGSFQFKGIVEEITLRFTMFLSDGKPCRATAAMAFKEYKTAQEQTEGPHGNQSPDHSKRRTLKQGETLSLIAGEEYGDPGEWRRIANANGIADPLNVKPGTLLTLPPLA